MTVICNRCGEATTRPVVHVTLRLRLRERIEETLCRRCWTRS